MGKDDGVWKALADPTRREILGLLQKRGMYPGEIIPHFKMTKPSLSHHLDILKKAGLILPERKGQKIMYSLNATVFDEVYMLMMNLFKKKGSR
jgi:ArsR family transcriptional regulator, arsenate/arsenite/antimonite-responsive transcriptional repressor